MGRAWGWGLFAAVWIFGTVALGLRSREEGVDVVDCHAPWVSVGASVAIALFGSWWIADRRDDRRFPVVLVCSLVLWCLTAFAWPALFSESCGSGR